MATDVSFRCTVITPERQVLDAQATFLAFPAHDGEMGILRDRAPLLCKLGSGRLRIHSNKGAQHWFIDGGFAQVLDNRVTILTQEALLPEQIDRTEAQALLAEAAKITVTDDITARRKAHLEASARARLRIAR